MTETDIHIESEHHARTHLAAVFHDIKYNASSMLSWFVVLISDRLFERHPEKA